VGYLVEAHKSVRPVRREDECYGSHHTRSAGRQKEKDIVPLDEYGGVSVEGGPE
jgi:hypothetical protein